MLVPLIFQKDIIQPVRDALDYYTQMQNALDEEKEKKQKEKNKEKAKHNGLTNQVNGDINFV